MNWLAQIAPTIASAVGGPLGGLAYEHIKVSVKIKNGIIRAFNSSSFCPSRVCLYPSHLACESNVHRPYFFCSGSLLAFHYNDSGD
jgi:hypothetical protein